MNNENKFDDINKVLGYNSPVNVSALTETLLDIAPTAISVLSPEGNIIYSNKKAIEILGYEINELEGKRYNSPNWEILDFDSNPLPPEELPFMKVLQSKQPVIDSKFTVIRNDGSRIYLNINVAPLLNSDGEIISVVTAFEDITKLVLSEKAKLEKENLYKSILMASPDGISIVDLNGKIKFASENCLKMFACENEEQMLDKSIFEFIDIIDIFKAKNEFSNYSSSNKPVIFKGKRIDNTTFYFESRREPIYDDSNNIISFIDIKRDISNEVAAKETITARTNELLSANKRLQELYEAIKESDSNYKQLFNELPSGFAYHRIVTDENGIPIDYIFLELNPAFEKLTGLNRSDIINKKIKTVMPGTENYWIERYGKVALSGEPDHFENYSSELNKYYYVSVYSPRKYFFAVIFSDVSERIKIEKELIINKNKYQTLADSSLAGIWQIDLDGNTIYINKAMLSFLEINSKEDLEGISYKSFFSTQSLAENKALRENFFADGSSFEAEIISKYGNVLDMIISTAVILDHDKNPISYIGTFINITVQKKYLKALRQSDERFKLIADYSNHWEIFTDSDSSIIYSSPGIKKILGVDNSEVDLIHLSDLSQFVYDEDVSAFNSIIVNALDENLIENYELRIKNINNEILWVSLSAQPVYESLNSFSGIRLSINDINKQKNTELKLILSEKKYKTFLDNAPYGILLSDFSGNYMEANKTAEKILGYSTKEITTLNIMNITHLEDISAAREIISQVKNEGKASSIIRAIRKDNIVFFAQIDSIALNSNYFLLFIYDITQSVIANEKIKEKESNIRAVIDNNLQAILLFDSNGILLEYNKKAIYIIKDLFYKNIKIGSRILEALPVNTNLLLSNFRKCLAGERISIELQISILEMEYWFVFSFEPVIKDKNISGVCLSILDITSMKIAESALTESNLKYEMLVNNMRDLVCLLDQKGTFIFINKQYSEVLGYSREELIGKNPRYLLHADDIELSKAKYYDLIDRITETNDIWRFKHKSGNYLTFECRSSRFQNSKGEIFIAVISTNISEKLLAQEKIQKNAEELELITDGLPILLARIDNNFNIVFSNKAFKQFFGIINSNENLVLTSLIADFQFEPLEKALENAFKGNSSKFEIELSNFQNDTKVMDIILVPHFDKEIPSCLFIASDITDLKDSETAYEYQTEFNTIILQTVGALIIVVNDEGQIELFNKAAEQITGYSMGYVFGKNYWDLFLDYSDAEIGKIQIERMVHSGMPEKLPGYILHKNGTKRDIEWNFTIMSVGENESKYIICSGINITEAIMAEKAVKNVSEAINVYVGEKFFDNLVINLNLMLRSDYTFISSLIENNTATQTISYCYQNKIIDNIQFELEGTPCNDAIFSGIMSIEENIQDMYPNNDILKRLDISGYVGVPLYDTLRNPIGLIVCLYKNPVQDVALAEDILKIFAVRTAAEIERLNAENSMKLREESFRALTENSPDITLRFDLDANIIYSSDNIYTITGLSSNEFTNKHISELSLDSKLTDLWTTSINEIISSKSMQSSIIEIPIVYDTLYIEWRLIPEFDEKGFVASILAIGRDMTNQKKVEKELILAKEKAEESDKLKSAFLANMSHEIRTPMNAIIGFANLLKYDDLSEEEKIEYINIINNRGNDLLKIISDIIDLSKIESGTLTIKNSAFSINEFLNNSFEEYSKLAVKKFQKEIEHRLNIPDDSKDYIIDSDSLRIRQILNNLYENAMKFTEDGFVEIGYKIIGNNIQIYVKDSGIGIPESKLQVIFDRFRQVDDSHSRLFGGAGLGLSISTKLIKMLGGEISVSSIENRGTTFFFTIPLFKESENSLFIKEKKYGENTPFDINKQTILVAEDDVTNFLVIEKYLKLFNANIIWAKNGEECFTMAKENKNICMIYMDLRMPILNGFEATKAIREFNTNIPIVALTAYAYADDMQRCLESGCTDYLTKPFTIEALVEVMKKYLK